MSEQLTFISNMTDEELITCYKSVAGLRVKNPYDLTPEESDLRRTAQLIWKEACDNRGDLWEQLVKART